MNQTSFIFGLEIQALQEEVAAQGDSNNERV